MIAKLNPEQDQLLKYSQKNFTDLFEQLQARLHEQSLERTCKFSHVFRPFAACMLIEPDQGLALAVEGRAKHSKVHRRPSDSKAQQPCASKGAPGSASERTRFLNIGFAKCAAS